MENNPSSSHSYEQTDKSATRHSFSYQIGQDAACIPLERHRITNVTSLTAIPTMKMFSLSSSHTVGIPIRLLLLTTMTTFSNKESLWSRDIEQDVGKPGHHFYPAFERTLWLQKDLCSRLLLLGDRDVGLQYTLSIMQK